MANKNWIQTGIDGLTFGERLGDLISNKGITQSQLADETGVKQSAISEYINGKQGGTLSRAPDCATIIALARYFSVSADYLLGLSAVKTPSVDTQAIVAQTGLNEENVRILQFDSARELFKQIHNDAIEFVSSDTAVNYALMLAALKVPAPSTSCDPDCLIDELLEMEQLHDKGYIRLTGEDAFYYHCASLSKIYEKALISKYLPVAEWRTEDGHH